MRRDWWNCCAKVARCDVRALLTLLVIPLIFVLIAKQHNLDEVEI